MRARALLVCLALAVACRRNDTSLDAPPILPPAAPLTVPAVAASTMPNGMHVLVVEQHELPLVQVTVVVTGGSRLDGLTPGIASFTADMLDEGAGDRPAVALQSELAYLGATLATTADWDRTTVSLKVPTRTLSAALDIMADVVLRPTFAPAEIRRQRDLRLATLARLRDQPTAVADLAFNQSLFPEANPYHRSASGERASVLTFTEPRVRAFYTSTFRPDRATAIVVGDLSAEQAASVVTARFGQWHNPAAAAHAIPAVAAVSPPIATRVVLVDKPEAAQSVITIGWPGVERTTPDYAALVVMNSLLGGAFTSRLNMELRERKGYTYGASSRFAFRVAPGPFTAAASVRTDVTDSSLVEFFRQLRAVRDSLVPDDELARARTYVELGLPAGLESTTQIAGQIAQLGVFGLGLDELPRFVSQVRAVTAADVQRVAQKYLMPARALVVVVGDLARVRRPIQALNLGSITELPIGAVAR